MNGTSLTSGSKYTVPGTAVKLAATFTYVGDAPGPITIISGGDVPGSATPGEINVMTTDGSLRAEGTVTNNDPGVTVDIDGESFAQMSDLAEKTGVGVIINTGTAVVTFDSSAVQFIDGVADSQNVVLEIEEVDASDLTSANRQIIGNHPVYDFTLTTGSVKIQNFGGKSAISIPYTLQSGETAETVIVYYMDDNGKLQIIRGAYKAETKTVNFTVEHFSLYALGSNMVAFSDVDENDWHHKAVTFIAAREITLGIGNGMYGPDNQITRGEFLVMLMRAYGIEPDENPTDNFSDAGDMYYTNYLAAAKRLGITSGIGSNMYAPDDNITRQDMFTLLYRALDVLDELPEVEETADLTAFPDSGSIADYAWDAFETFVAAGIVSGTNGSLAPTAMSTRAQMAQILYNLLSK
jgi:hypothetical protein